MELSVIEESETGEDTNSAYRNVKTLERTCSHCFYKESIFRESRLDNTAARLPIHRPIISRSMD